MSQGKPDLDRAPKTACRQPAVQFCRGGTSSAQPLSLRLPTVTLGIRDFAVCGPPADLGIRNSPVCVYFADLGIHNSPVCVYLSNLCIPNSRQKRAHRETASSVPAVTFRGIEITPLARYTQLSLVYTTLGFAYTKLREGQCERHRLRNRVDRDLAPSRIGAPIAAIPTDMFRTVGGLPGAHVKTPAAPRTASPAWSPSRAAWRWRPVPRQTGSHRQTSARTSPSWYRTARQTQ